MFSKFDILVKISWLYYVRNFTQTEIASRLYISRAKVQRMLIKAKEEGIVQIKIAHQRYNLLSLEETLKDIFHLEDVVIVPSNYSSNGKLLKEDLGKAAALYLDDKFSQIEFFGVGMGDTLKYFANNLVSDANLVNKDLKIISLFGNLLPNVSWNPYSIGNKIAEKLKVLFYGLWAPARVDSIKTAQLIKEQDLVKNVFLIMEKVEFSLVGIGDIKNGIITKYGLTNKDDIKDLIKEGAVGEILGYWFDINGLPVLPKLREKLIGAPVKIPGKTIAVAGGKEKIKAIVGALRGHLVDILITDETCAKKLISKYNKTFEKK
jgi:DNA-binding transcriptional regulator LsrR (DeoR family)